MALFHVIFGPIVWMLHLAAVYGGVSLTCLGRESRTAMLGLDAAQLTVIGATLAAFAILCAPVALRIVAHRQYNGLPARDAHARVTALLIALSAVGVAWAGSTIFFIPACTALR
jgi:hypothetical protein